MHVRSRAVARRADMPPGIPLADLVARNLSLLSFEISFGRLCADAWIVGKSTLPWLENSTVAVRIRHLDNARLEPDFNGDVQRWKILE